MKLIGKGAFTKCYLKDCGEKVLLKTTDPIKECYSMGWIESDMFPVYERIDCGMYECEYYPRTKSLKNNLDPDQWAKYKALRYIGDHIVVHNRYDGYRAYYEAFEGLEDEELRDAMIDALDSVSNYSSEIGFEISPRNVAVKNGKLILLDVFFCKRELDRVRTKQ